MTNQSVAKKRRPAARPGEILEAALTLFTERGFEATRLEDVASRAGLSKAAIYLYFKDKVSILQALVQDLVGSNIAMAQGLVAEHQGPVEPVMRLLFEVVAERMTTTRLPYIIKLIVSESGAHPEIGRWYLEMVIGKAMPLFRGLIEAGIAQGEFRAVDADHTVKSLIAPMLLGALWKTVFEPIGAAPLDIRSLARNHIDIVVRGLKP
jgi:AcrR family transcriptional regulator